MTYEDISAMAEWNYECMLTTSRYQQLMDMMEAIDERNKAIVNGNRVMYEHYTRELMCEHGLGDC